MIYVGEYVLYHLVRNHPPVSSTYRVHNLTHASPPCYQLITYTSIRRKYSISIQSVHKSCGFCRCLNGFNARNLSAICQSICVLVQCCLGVACSCINSSAVAHTHTEHVFNLYDLIAHRTGKIVTLFTVICVTMRCTAAATAAAASTSTSLCHRRLNTR